MVIASRLRVFVLGLLVPVGCSVYSDPGVAGGPDSGSSGATSTGGMAGGMSSGSGGSGGVSAGGTAGSATGGAGGSAGSATGGAAPRPDASDRDASEASDGNDASSESDGDRGSAAQDAALGDADECPDDRAKTAPGKCGCGFPETATCLVHRYAFDALDLMAVDSVGSAAGSIVNGNQVGGAVALAGGTSDQYVTLPSKLLDGLVDATFEAWVTWTGNADWERIFDFGTNDAPAGERGNGISYFFLTPRNQHTHVLRAGFSLDGNGNEFRVDGHAALTSTLTQVAVVIQGATLTLYQDGALQGTTAFTVSLSQLNPANVWLGRSQYTTDPAFSGSIEEFRIYSRARSAVELAASHAAGPNVVPTQ